MFLETCLHLFNKWIRSVVEQFGLVLDNSKGKFFSITLAFLCLEKVELIIIKNSRRNNVVKSMGWLSEFNSLRNTIWFTFYFKFIYVEFLL